MKNTFKGMPGWLFNLTSSRRAWSIYGRKGRSIDRRITRQVKKRKIEKISW